MAELLAPIDEPRVGISYHPRLPLFGKVVRIFYRRRADQEEYFDALPLNQRWQTDQME